MGANAGTLWTLDELGRKVAEALAGDYEGPPNERARDGPDLRPIRHYTTMGLGDSPEAPLVLAGARPMDGEDLEAIRKAAGPLLGLRERRGRLGPRPGGGDR